MDPRFINIMASLILAFLTLITLIYHFQIRFILFFLLPILKYLPQVIMYLNENYYVFLLIKFFS